MNPKISTLGNNQNKQRESDERNRIAEVTGATGTIDDELQQ